VSVHFRGNRCQFRMAQGDGDIADSFRKTSSVPVLPLVGKLALVNQILADLPRAVVVNAVENVAVVEHGEGLTVSDARRFADQVLSRIQSAIIEAESLKVSSSRCSLSSRQRAGSSCSNA
jgi:hypothetical protein